VEAGEEAQRLRIACMLTADADLEIGVRTLAALDGQRHQLAYALFVERHEGIELVEALALVGGEEGGRVVARDAVGGLREVVGAEGEEVDARGDVPGPQTGARQLD